MKSTLSGAIVLFAMVTLAAGTLRADQRSYVWTYQYMTVPRGEAEIESYFTLSAPDIHRLKGNTSTEHRIELEVGMTDRFDFAIYQIFSQGPQEGLQYDGFQLRGRYRIGEKDQYFLDPLIYLEYKAAADLSEQGLETKLILAKDIGRFNVALNPILGYEFGAGSEWEAEYAAGMSYSVSRLFRIGVEAKGSEDGHYIGPVISHGGRFWVALGSAINVGNVGEGKPEFQMRMLLGVGL
jgi:hypothetical protein